MTITCPGCGAPVPFQSAVSVFATCAFCRSMLVRRDLNLEVIGKMAVVLDDPTPLQLQTHGRFDNKPFALIGRLRLAWTDGSWNEWCALFVDGRYGWLAEAQGFYMMSFATTDTATLPDAATIQPGMTVRIGGRSYSVDDIKRPTCAGSEGELPFPALVGRQSVSIDCSGPGETFASLDYSEDGVQAYAGRYVDFADLKLSNLRKLDGW